MAGTGFVQARGFLGAFTLGLGQLFAGGLRGGHVTRGGQQNRLGMVAQGCTVHVFGRRRDGTGELFPFINDTVHVLPDEVGEAHDRFPAGNVGGILASLPPGKNYR
ncbi:hypothetical protein D3C73_661810 [compost metagenome]